MSEEQKARREVIPIFQPTRIGESRSPTTISVHHRFCGKDFYYIRERIGKGSAAPIARVPIVVDARGIPWAEATLYLLYRAKRKPLNTDSLVTIAADLAKYKFWIDEYGFAWDDFNSAEEFDLPTYQYLAYVEAEIAAGRISQNVGSRRMSSLIGMYRHLMKYERYNFRPAHPPWNESIVKIRRADKKGFINAIEVATTDLAIPKAEKGTEWDFTIDDGGKLRPLPYLEQKALFAALHSLGNPEYWLMHAISVLTGARLQTVLTMRLRDFLAAPSSIGKLYKLKCGPATGIDTKNDRSKVWLSMPKELYIALHVYAQSPRAQRRQDKSALGRGGDNYLFLTQHGNSYYEADEHLLTLGAGKYSKKVGQGIWDFINKRVIPVVRKTLPDFHYQFHDMRATFGLNWCDAVATIEDSEYSYKWALEQLSQRMWHKDLKVTMKYLGYREKHKMLEKAEEAYAHWMNGLVKSGFDAINQ